MRFTTFFSGPMFIYAAPFWMDYLNVETVRMAWTAPIELWN
jgi:hypothetical protein